MILSLMVTVTNSHKLLSTLLGFDHYSGIGGNRHIESDAAEASIRAELVDLVEYTCPIMADRTGRMDTVERVDSVENAAQAITTW